MKKIIMIMVGLLLIACGKEDNTIKIGVTQIIEHPALDNTVVGFKRALAEGGYGNVEIEEQNAQGDFATAQTIAGSYARTKDLILAVSTPSAQAAYNATKETPILITAVTEPKSAGLIADNISGTSDASPIDKQVELITKLLPNAKKIGVIYSTSEQNSLIILEELKIEASKKGLEVVEVGVTSVNEIALALDSVLGQIDVLYTPTDNLVVSATPLVLEKANSRNIPVVGSIEEQVNQGALATETIDYEKLGYQTGQMAVRILNGEDVSSMPIETLQDTQTIINSKTAKRLGIELNEDQLKGAIII